METRPDSDVALETVEVEVASTGCDLAGVGEQRHVEAQTVRDPAPLERFKHAMAIAEAPARISAQRTAAAERGQQEIRHYIVVVQGGLHLRAERHHPVFAQDRQVLN